MAGDVDLAFVRLARAPHPDLCHLRLSRASMLLAVPSGHALAGGRRPVPLRALDGEPLAFYHREQNPWWYDEVMALLDQHGARPRIVHRGLWVYDVLPQVSAGHTVALVSTTSATEITLPGVVYRALEPAPTISLGLLWRPYEASATLDGFIAVARTIAP